jgi:hypothetical protein
MSFQRLAQVEVQCIMQMLDRPSLLALARCNTQILQTADAPFAWKHMPPKLVDDIPIIAHRLGRHIPIQWMKCERCIRLVDDITRLRQRLNQPCNLRGFRIVKSSFVTWMLWSQFVSCVAMQSVHYVCIASAVLSEDEITALCSLPNLTSIMWHVSPNGCWMNHLHSGLLPSNITSLHVGQTIDLVTADAFTSFLSCVHVTQFTIRLNAGNNRAFLTSLANRRTLTITQLTIVGLMYQFPDVASTFAAAFRGILSLTLSASSAICTVFDRLSDCSDLCELHLVDEPFDVTPNEIVTALERLHASNQAKKNTMRIHLHFTPDAFSPSVLLVLQSAAYLTLCDDPYCPTRMRAHFSM